jgi:hypothetical protein
VIGHGDKVVVAVRTPGVDAYRVRQSDDRDYVLFTVRDGRIVALRDCRNRRDALRLAGIERAPVAGQPLPANTARARRHTCAVRGRARARRPEGPVVAR